MKQFSFFLRRGAIFGAAILLLASTRGDAQNAPTDKPYRETRRETLGDKRIDESSGLCRSVRYSNWLWTHNDSGDSARLFLLDESGATRAVANLEGAQSIDWEDCATGAPDKSGAAWIYSGDIGDNNSRRQSITIYRFREPALPASTRAMKTADETPPKTPRAVSDDLAKSETAAPETARVLAAPNAVNADAPQLSVACEAMTLHYPDGAHDAETLIIAPDHRVLIVTKSFAGSEIFIAPQTFVNGATQTLRKIGARQFTDGGFFGFLATGGDLNAGGTRLAIRTYTRVYEWRRDPKDNSDAAWRALFARAPQAFDAPATRQGEAICYDARGALFFSSEKIPTPLIEMQR